MNRSWTLLVAIALVAPLPAAVAVPTPPAPSDRPAAAAPSPSEQLQAEFDRALSAAEANAAASGTDRVDQARALFERGRGLAETQTPQEALEQVASERDGPASALDLAAEAGLAGKAAPLEQANQLTPALGPGTDDASSPHPALAAQPSPFGAAPEHRPAASAEGIPVADEVPPTARAPLQEIAAVYATLADAVPKEPSPADVARLQAARDEALERLVDSAHRLQAAEPGPTIVRCEAEVPVAIDLSGTSQTYECPLSIVVDVGGNDTYRNNAGGSANGAALLLDLAGDDVYEPAPEAGPAVVGATRAGGAVLADLGGDDEYRVQRSARAIATGSAIAGAAVLYDGGGSDTYSVQTGPSPSPTLAHGSSLGGSAALLDEGGSDRYEVGAEGLAAANGAAFNGLAWLVDERGDDRYNGTIEASGAANGASGNLTIHHRAADSVETLLSPVSGHATFPNDQPRNAAITVDLHGTGLLHDAAGDDVYLVDAVRGLANGASGQGVGVLVDGAGADRYEATIGERGAANGAGALGLGALADAGGHDTYDAEATSGALQGAGHIGAGLLLDTAGDDDYASRLDERGAAHGAASFGVGLLADAAGNNTHSAGGPATGATLGSGHGLPLPEDGPAGDVEATLELQVGTPASLGLLLGGTGDDVYVADGVTQGAGQLYGTGLLVDVGGRDTYEATDAGPAQGAGAFGGVGLLVDAGTETTFRLGPDSFGQGAGIQGAGLLLRTPSNRGPQARTVYDTAQETEPLTSGGGVGLLVDATNTEGLQAPEACRTDPLFTSSAAGASTFVCEPRSSAQVPILDPVSGEAPGPQTHDEPGPLVSQVLDQVAWEAGTIPKAPLCGSLIVGSQACLDALGQVLPPEAVEWFERDYANATTDGALEVGIGGDDGGDALERATGGDRWVLHEMGTADDGCRPWCWTLTAT